MFVKPAQGVQVRDPISRSPLPAEGRDVPESSYWTRRLSAGDVVLVALRESIVVPDEQINVFSPDETEPS